MKKELKEISLLKNLMMITVVAYHSSLFFNGNWFVSTPVYDAKYITYFTFWLNTFHIQTFTFASGYIFFYLKSIGKYTDIKKDIKNRTKRLLVPLLFTELLWVIPFYIHYWGDDIKAIIHKFILLESPNQLWFLPMLFLIFIFFNVFYKKIKFSFKNMIIIYSISTILSFALRAININYFNIAKAIQFSLYFYLGGYIFYYKEKLTKSRIIIATISSLILLLIVEYLNNFNILVIKIISQLIIPILGCLEAILLYKLSDYIINKRNLNINNRIYNLLQENSFGIYLFHQQIIYITITILNGLVNPIIQCIISFIVSLCCSFIISIILRKNRITKEMFGL